MRTLYAPIIAVAGLLAIGCGNSKQLEADLAAANTRAQELDSMLTVTQNQFQAEKEKSAEYQLALASAQEKHEDLNSSLNSANAQVKKLQSNLTQARAECTKALDSLNVVKMAVQSDLKTCETDLTDTQMRLETSELHAGSLMQTRDSLFGFVDDVRPWYGYYKQESHRNWLKKLFGAGRAKKPEKAEPSFDTKTTPANLEVNR